MTTPPLEDRLTRLADGLVAPATPEVRSAIGQRAGVLRRRRRTRQAAGAGIVVLAAVAGTIAVTRGATPEAKTEMSDSPDLPAVVLDLDGWELTSAEDTTVPTGPPPAGSEQVFARAGDPDGPRIVLRHAASSDAHGPTAADEQSVDIGGVEGYVTHPGADEVVVQWSPPLGDNTAEIEARGVTEDEVLSFARGLQPKNQGEITFPPTSETQWGFVAGFVPEGFAEVPAADAEASGSDAPDDTPARRLTAQRGGATAELRIAVTGDAPYPWFVELPPGAEIDELTVLGHPATLVQQPGKAGWWLTWRPRDGATARLDVTGVDAAAVDDVTRGLREVTDDEWDDLVAAQGG